MSSSDSLKANLQRGDYAESLKHRSDDVPPRRLRKRAPACSTGHFYVSPQPGENIDTSRPLNIIWDTSLACFDESVHAIDISLYAPSLPSPKLLTWYGIDYAAGSFQTSLKPKWWNATSKIDLHLVVVETQVPTFLSDVAMSMPFKAMYIAPPAGSPISEDADTSTPNTEHYQVVNNSNGRRTGLSPGSLAAAVLLPLLLVIGVIGAYIWYSRRREAERRRVWTEAVDKRMSQISMDWQSISIAGASAVIRNSMATDGRNRTTSFGAASILDAEGRQRKSSFASPFVGEEKDVEDKFVRRARAMSTGSRLARVSFAEDARPSVEIARARVADGFRNRVPSIPTDYQRARVPSMPTLPHARLTGAAQDPPRHSVDTRPPRRSADLPPLPPLYQDDDTAAALSLMRVSSNDVEPVVGPQNSIPFGLAPSPFGMTPSPVAAGGSPDEMLASYAATNQSSPSNSGGAKAHKFQFGALIKKLESRVSGNPHDQRY